MHARRWPAERGGVRVCINSDGARWLAANALLGGLSTCAGSSLGHANQARDSRMRRKTVMDEFYYYA
jgi:hypothetical protein